jgi:hypothetical protein
MDVVVHFATAVEGQEALCAITRDMHAQVLVHGSTWSSFEGLVEYFFESVNLGAGGVCV